MPIHYVPDQGITRVAFRPSVTMTTSDGAVLTARGDADDPAPRTLTPKPGMLVAQMVGSISVVASPADGRPFPAGTVIDFQVVAGNANDPDADIVRLAGLDVGGLTEVDLVRLEPAEPWLEITRSSREIDRESLTGLAAQAQAQARQVLACDRLSDDDAWLVTVAVDFSASMRPHHESGAVATILEVLVGCLKVVARNGNCRAAAVGAATEVVADVSAVRLISWYQDIATPTWGHGAPISALARQAEEGGPAMLFLVTDGIPSVDFELALPQPMCLVPLLPPAVWPLVGLGWDRPAHPVDAVADGAPLAERWAAAPDEVGQFVRTVLTAQQEGVRS